MTEQVSEIKNPLSFQLPFRMNVFGTSVTPKNLFLVQLIVYYCFLPGGTFETITVITESVDVPIYKYLKQNCPLITISEKLEDLKSIDDFDTNQKHLVCFDCVQNLIQNKEMHDFWLRSRTRNISIIWMDHNVLNIPRSIRQLSNYTVLYNVHSKRDVSILKHSDVIRDDLTVEGLSNIFKMLPTDVPLILHEKDMIITNEWIEYIKTTM